MVTPLSSLFPMDEDRIPFSQCNDYLYRLQREELTQLFGLRVNCVGYVCRLHAHFTERQNVEGRDDQSNQGGIRGLAGFCSFVAVRLYPRSVGDYRYHVYSFLLNW